jgi:hypothetical protein
VALLPAHIHDSLTDVASGGSDVKNFMFSQQKPRLQR